MRPCVTIERMENKCPFCDKINPPSASVCESCNCKLPMGNQVEMRPAPVPRSGPNPLAGKLGGLFGRRPPVQAPPRKNPACLDSCVKQTGIGCGILVFFLVFLPLSCTILSPKPKVVPVVFDSTPTPVPTLVAAPLSEFPVVGATSAPVAATEKGEVWVNDSTKIYHFPNSRWYGNTNNGHYSSEAAAKAAGHRAAENGQ